MASNLRCQNKEGRPRSHPVSPSAPRLGQWCALPDRSWSNLLWKASSLPTWSSTCLEGISGLNGPGHCPLGPQPPLPCCWWQDRPWLVRPCPASCGMALGCWLPTPGEQLALILAWCYCSPEQSASVLHCEKVCPVPTLSPSCCILAYCFIFYSPWTSWPSLAFLCSSVWKICRQSPRHLCFSLLL